MIRIALQGKSFHGKPVLGPVTLDLEHGKVVAILGPSGIGKTTLLRIIAGLDTEFEGDIPELSKIAMVFQEPTLLPWRSAIDNLTIIHPRLGRTAALDWLARVGLSGKEDLFPGQLSLGQQRRLALARAFAGQPELLIMDEPFASLDQTNAEIMLGLTRDMIAERNPAALFVTHDPRHAEILGDRLLELRGSPATLHQMEPLGGV